MLASITIAVRFLLEVASLLALGYWGFQTGNNLLMKLLFGIGAPILIMVMWGFFGSPAAPYLLKGWQHLLFEFVIFSLGPIALLASGRIILAISLFITFLLNRLLLAVVGH